MSAVGTDPARRYGLRAACAKCPFRTDVPPYLRPGRAAEIAKALREGGEFPCHETTERRVDEAGEAYLADGARSRFCAGAMATMLTEGQPNQMLRIAIRLGWLDPDRLAAADIPVHPSLADWVRAHRLAEGEIPTVTLDDGEVIEFEHCGIVEDGCEDPAGYGGYGGYAPNDDPPTCNPLTDECAGCSRTACTACRSEHWNEPGDQFCVACWNDEEERG